MNVFIIGMGPIRYSGTALLGWPYEITWKGETNFRVEYKNVQSTYYIHCSKSPKEVSNAVIMPIEVLNGSEGNFLGKYI